ncbi:MAG: polysaccharide pyruvyl transferase family protein [Anaerolineae bacterium]|nr:polysaccharide pyruvyl transferase family protein [Anaerolineae bacterium]
MNVSSIMRFLTAHNHRAIYLGWVGYGNLGDEALYTAIRQLFGDRLTFFAPKFIGSRLTSLAPNLHIDVVFLGGGTLIGRENINIRLQSAFDAYPTATFVAVGTGVLDYTLWQSFGATMNTTSWQKTLDRFDLLTVRGPLSLNHLAQMNIQHKARITGDPVLWLGRATTQVKPKKKRVGLNLGPSSGLIHGRDEAGVAQFGANLLRHLEQQGWEVTLFPMIPEDEAYLQAIVTEAKITSVQFHRKYHNLTATLAALEKQDVFIGEKLHSVVLANCVHIPAIMLEYRTKCRDYMMSMDQEHLTFRTDELDVHRIYDTLFALYNESEVYQSHLASRIQYWQHQLKQTADDVLTIMTHEH